MSRRRRPHSCAGVPGQKRRPFEWTWLPPGRRRDCHDTGTSPRPSLRRSGLRLIFWPSPRAGGPQSGWSRYACEPRPRSSDALLQVELPEGLAKFKKRASTPDGIHEDVQVSLVLARSALATPGPRQDSRGRPRPRPRFLPAPSRAPRSPRSFPAGRSSQKSNRLASAAHLVLAASSDPCSRPSLPLRRGPRRFPGQLPGSRLQQVRPFRADRVACKRRAWGASAVCSESVALGWLPINRHCKTHVSPRASEASG